MSEIYQGIKFNAKNTGEFSGFEKKINELEYWCGIFKKYEFAPAYHGGSSGNLSCRVSPKNDFLITASHTSLSDNMKINDFAYVENVNSVEKTILYKGNRTPSSESILHYFIFKVRPDINAVFHGHYEFFLKFAEDLKIPSTSKEYEYGTIEIAKASSELSINNNFFILKNHGFVALGKTQEIAGKVTLSFYEKVKKYL